MSAYLLHNWFRSFNRVRSVMNEAGRTFGVAVAVAWMQFLLWSTPDHTLQTHTLNMANFIHPDAMFSASSVEIENIVQFRFEWNILFSRKPSESIPPICLYPMNCVILHVFQITWRILLFFTNDSWIVECRAFTHLTGKGCPTYITSERLYLKHWLIHYNFGWLRQAPIFPITGKGLLSDGPLPSHTQPVPESTCTVENVIINFEYTISLSSHSLSFPKLIHLHRLPICFLLKLFNLIIRLFWERSHWAG